MVKKNIKRPMVRVQWYEGKKSKCKSFCIGKKRTFEQAMELANKYHNEIIIPKYEQYIKEKPKKISQSITNNTDERCNMCGYMESNCHCGSGYNQRLDTSSYNASYNSYRMK